MTHLTAVHNYFLLFQMTVPKKAGGAKAVEEDARDR